MSPSVNRSVREGQPNRRDVGFVSNEAVACLHRARVVNKMAIPIHGKQSHGRNTVEQPKRLDLFPADGAGSEPENSTRLPDPSVDEADTDDLHIEDLLIEDISIDGMCGVY